MSVISFMFSDQIFGSGLQVASQEKYRIVGAMFT
jgi:hypothetical protein